MMTDTNTDKIRFSSQMSFVTKGNVTVTQADTASEEPEDEMPGGFQEGFDAGYNQASLEAQAMIEQLNANIEQLNMQLQHIRQELPEAINESLTELENQASVEAVELAFMAAERIVHHEIGKETPIRFAIAEALGRLTHLNGVKLMLSPADFELLEVEAGAVPPGIEMVQDASLAPGEIFLETQQGFLDGKIHTRLAELRDQFLEILTQAGTDDAETD